MLLACWNPIAFQNPDGQAAAIGTVADGDHMLVPVQLDPLVGQCGQRDVEHIADPHRHPFLGQPHIDDDGRLGRLHLFVQLLRSDHFDSSSRQPRLLPRIEVNALALVADAMQPIESLAHLLLAARNDRLGVPGDHDSRPRLEPTSQGDVHRVRNVPFGIGIRITNVDHVELRRVRQIGTRFDQRQIDPGPTAPASGPRDSSPHYGQSTEGLREAHPESPPQTRRGSCTAE